MNKTLTQRHSQGGFTLVELVVVMVILGILAATALPKFMSVNTQAHEAAVAGVGGALTAAVALARAQWIANGLTGEADNVAGFGDSDIDTNAAGWAVQTDDTNTAPDLDDCVLIWSALMQNPPSVATSGTVDYISTATGGICTYTYQGAAGMTILYNSNTGAMTIDSTI